MAEHQDTKDLSNLASDFSGDYELDKTGGAWFLTGWLNVKPRIVLRLKVIKQFGASDPFDVLCEARRPGRREFEAVASFASLDQFALLDTCMCEVPEVWRRAFLAMFRRLSRVLDAVDVAACDGERYAAEPLSSRDYLAFGATDDMPPRS
jgi:hypothetical protein